MSEQSEDRVGCGINPTPVPSPQGGGELMSSREETMDEPGGTWGMGFAIDAFAINPEAAAVLILDNIVIARTLGPGAAVPPFGRDTFRAFHAQDAMGDAPPGESQRRTIGNLGHDVNFFRTVEKG